MLEWDEFVRCCREIEAVSTTLDDGWRCVVDKEDEPGYTYLEKRCTMLHKTPGQHASWSGDLQGAEEDEIEGMQHDQSTVSVICSRLKEAAPDPCCAEAQDHGEEVLQCVYNVVYSASYGVPVMYFNVWRRDGSLLPLSDVWSLMPECLQEQLKHLRWSTVTQQEHPIQGVPYFQLHPCKTAQLMEQTRPRDQDGKHSNYVVTWLSSVAPVVGLEFPVQYSAIAAPPSS
ncbi:ubiquitin-like-conjugating enzyme ATG10 isoform X1 [Rhipicephalus sanguineus]|uniref:ubiquitin-like-conjugating enzyme ATG10 isoform X1 n=1 Tax=Rhipicephalus sanguineus TaxID=34632 RepID=UPI001895E8AC|nr:ubiquitin-like-conjugating enzyme ATG10 isoform X1 [Rhipicephalus sanguineus]